MGWFVTVVNYDVYENDVKTGIESAGLVVKATDREEAENLVEEYAYRNCRCEDKNAEEEDYPEGYACDLHPKLGLSRDVYWDELKSVKSQMAGREFLGSKDIVLVDYSPVGELRVNGKVSTPEGWN